MASVSSYYRNYFEHNPQPLNCYERDYISNSKSISESAFRPRPAQRTALQKPPRSRANLDINHRMRTYVADCVKPKPSDAFRLWIELGRRQPPYPPKWDEHYNSNVWKNFSQGEGYHMETPGQTISETIALAYPIRIPPHSEMKAETLSKFLAESPKLFKSTKRQNLAVEHSKKELKEFKLLKLRSQMRVPPMDGDGQILPPANMKYYDHPEVILPDNRTLDLRLKGSYDRDMDRHTMGIHPTSPFRLWKLSFKDNNPEYQRVQKEIEEKRFLAVSRNSAATSEILFK